MLILLTFPAPKLGRGLDWRLRLRTLRPMVSLCWLRAVCIRLRAVGCRSKSPWVETRLMPPAVRCRATLRSLEDVVDTDDAVDTTRSISLLAL